MSDSSELADCVSTQHSAHIDCRSCGIAVWHMFYYELQDTKILYLTDTKISFLALRQLLILTNEIIVLMSTEWYFNLLHMYNF